MYGNYLNDICNYLLDKYPFYIDNIDIINKLSYTLKDELTLIDNNTKTNNLTYKDIFDITSDIICKIDPFYLLSYVRLIELGILNFDYDNNSTSYFKHTKYNDININREFNYNDVISLIHEFIHYTNGNKVITYNRKILSEFLSIYFEFHGYNYLYKLNIPNNEINYHRRINNLCKCMQDYLKINIPLTLFIKEGIVVENEYLLNYFIKEENKYNCSKFFFERNYKELIKQLSKIYIKLFTYIFNTSLAFYAYFNCNIKDIVKLNNNINNYNLNISEILNRVGIDIYDNNFSNNVLNSIKTYKKIGSDL